MKRFVAVLCALVVAACALFAGDFYNGDVQIDVGGGFGSEKIMLGTHFADSVSAEFGLESWHLFKPIDMLGVGFMVALNMGVGESHIDWSIFNTQDLTFYFNFSVGPALGVYLGNIVRFGATIGFNFGYNFELTGTVIQMGSSSTISPSFYTTYLGFDVGLQAKFFPNSVVNPILGWNFVQGFSKQLNSDAAAYSSYAGVPAPYRFMRNTVYAGLSFSW